MLLTSEPHFDRIATLACFEPTKLSASQSHHTANLPSWAPSQVDAFPEPSKIQLDLILANQRNLERRMDKMEQLILQILKAL